MPIRMTRDFDREELETFTINFPQGKDFTVERRVRVGAEKKLVQMSQQLAFETGRPLVDAISHVIQQHPELLRLSRAQIDDRRADVVQR